jgi:proteasome lid subunit RPN8/RPN11
MRKEIYKLPYKERRRLHERSYRAQQRDGSEVCGLLLVGRDKRIELRFLRNIAKEPGKYNIDLREVKVLHRAISSHSKKILGSFHSHPVSEAVPGAGDLEIGFYRGIEMIYDVCGREIKLWSVKRNGKKRTAKELPLIIEGRLISNRKNIS